MERWQGDVRPRQGTFLDSQVYQWSPFYLKIGLDIYMMCFSKCFNFHFFFHLVYLQVVKKYSNTSSYMVKSTDWFLKKCTSRKQMVQLYRLQIFIFSGLVIGLWSELWAPEMFVPNSNLSTPPQGSRSGGIWICYLASFLYSSSTAQMYVFSSSNLCLLLSTMRDSVDTCGRPIFSANFLAPSPAKQICSV